MAASQGPPSASAASVPARRAAEPRTLDGRPFAPTVIEPGGAIGRRPLIGHGQPDLGHVGARGRRDRQASPRARTRAE